jgi:hypothetical protein
MGPDGLVSSGRMRSDLRGVRTWDGSPSGASPEATGYSTEPGIVVWRARYAAASARRATSSFDRIDET